MRRDWLRFNRRQAGRWLAGVALLALAAPPARAQAPGADADSPARLLPARDLTAYAEFDGLDAHQAAWQKTAAYKILAETTTGAMLEDLFAQVMPRLPYRDLTPGEALLVVKHVLKAGFALGENNWVQDGAKRHVNAIVFRNAFGNREIRPIFARLLQNLPAAGTKSQSVVRSGHRLISGKDKTGDTFYWLVEETKKADIIIITGEADSVDRVLDVMDGKAAAVLTSPDRADLLRPRDGFERTGFLMLDPEAMRRAEALPALGGTAIGRFDLVGGFRDDALVTISRLHRPGPDPKGASGALLALFDKATIPPIPAGVVGFATVGLNFKAIPARVAAIPALGDAFAKLLDDLKAKSKVRFEEDVLGQLGPKVTAYVQPNKGGGPTLSLPGAIGLTGAMGRPGVDFLPKFAILIDVANAATFGKTLDELMSYANRQLKAAFLTPPGPGNDPPPPPPPGSRRGGGPPGPPVPEFRLMLGETKSYVFTVPPELSARFPATFRPTFRLGPKQLAIGPSAEAARAALEAKGAYVPPTELAGAFGQLPGKLEMLMVVDPRDSTPEILAGLPGKVQAGFNTANPAALAAAAASPASPGGAKPPGATSPPPAAGPLVVQVDAAKLPAAAEIRRRLFPAIYTLDEEGDAIRFTTREAFPPIPDPAFLGLIAGAVRARLNPGMAVPAPADAPAAQPTPTPAPATAPATPAAADADRARQQQQRRGGRNEP